MSLVPVKGGRLPSEATVEIFVRTTAAIKEARSRIATIIREEKASAKRRRTLVRNAADKAIHC